MRALILWSDPRSTNLGVRVLAAGTGALVRAALGCDTELAYQGYGPGDAPVRIGDPRRLVRRLLHLSDELIDWLRGFDLVVDTRAGDSFSDIYGLPRHLNMSLVHEAVLRAKIPIVLGPQTVGPFGTRRGRALALRTVRSARLVMARDSESFAVARKLGAGRAVLTTDVVFALDRPRSALVQRDILLNVSGLLWDRNAHVDHVRYQQTVRQLVSELSSRGRTVSLLAHVLDSPLPDNDVPVGRLLAEELGVELVVPDDLDDVRSIVGGSRLVIGSRMHACLNALSVGTPALPLAYSRKFRPLLDALGWPHTVDLKTADQPVAQLLDAIEVEDLAAQAAVSRSRAQAEIADAADLLAHVVR